MPRFTMTHHSRPIVLLAALALTALTATRGAAQRLPLPDGARTHWVVNGPQEIVGYLVFDPATVAERLPSALRFISVGELARGGVSWAVQYLAGAPSRDAWGVSFVEIVRADTFTINGRAPRWPAHGAAALWFARVAPADSTADLGPGVPLLVLDLWVPDASYAAEMRRLGHYASYGNVKLLEDAHGAWHGSLVAEGLHVAAACTPSGAESGGPASRGMQALFPPARSGVSGVVRISFAGHRERACAEPESWTLGGTHPLALAEQVGPSSFEFGYELVGGAYPPVAAGVTGSEVIKRLCRGLTRCTEVVNSRRLTSLGADSRAKEAAAAPPLHVREGLRRPRRRSYVNGCSTSHR